MKDAEEPKRRAYDLQPVTLFTDEEGEKIHSLAVRDIAREADEREPELAGEPKTTGNHMAFWQVVRSRVASKKVCTRVIIRDDFKSIGIQPSTLRRVAMFANDEPMPVSYSCMKISP